MSSFWEDVSKIFFFLLKERAFVYLRLNFQEKNPMHQFFLQFQFLRILSWYGFKSQGLSFLSMPQGFSRGIVSSLKDCLFFQHLKDSRYSFKFQGLSFLWNFKDCLFFEMVIRNFFFDRYNYQRFFVNFFFYCSYNYQGFFVLTLVAYSPYRRVCQGFFVLTLVVYPPYGRFCQMPFHRVYQGVFGGLSLFWKGV